MMAQKRTRNVIVGLADTSCREMIAAVLKHLPVDVYLTDDGAEVLNRVTTLRAVDQDVALLVLGVQLRTFSGSQILRMIGQANDVEQTIVLATPVESDLLERVDLCPRTRVAPLNHASVELVIDCLAYILEKPAAREPVDCPSQRGTESKEASVGAPEACSTCGTQITSGMGRFRTPNGTYCLYCHSSPLAARSIAVAN